MTSIIETASEKPPAPSRLVSLWAPVGIVALVPLFLLFSRSHQIGDPDTFWHIRAGDFLFRTWQFSGPDPWSPFTVNPWVLHEWVPELVLSLADTVNGLAGVALAWYVGTVLVAAAFYAACRSQGRVVLSAIATVLALLGAAASLTPRPQLVSIGLSAIVTAAWLCSARDGKARWWLIPLTWVWACSHGMWFVSPMIGLAVVLGLALERSRSTRRLGAVALGCLAVAAFTPSGPSLLLAPLSVSGYTKFVSEWDPPRLASPPVAATLILLAVAVVIWVRSSRRVAWPLVLVWVVAMGWALAYTRTVAIAAAIAAPLVVGIVSTALPAESESGSERKRSRRFEWMTMTAGALLGVALATIVLPTTAATAAERMPVGLDATLDQLPAGTVVFNEYGLGGYLQYGHPDLIPVIDERTELYAVDYVQAYLDTRGARQGWSEFLARTGAKAAVVPTDSAIADALQQSLGWRNLGTSADEVLLVQPGLVP